MLIAAVPAGASSVAYIDGHNLWLSSPDGSQKFQMTQGGTEDASWNFPSQGPDGKTVVSHRDTFDGGSKRPVLYLYGADGKLITANVMPVYAGATAPVHQSDAYNPTFYGTRVVSSDSGGNIFVQPDVAEAPFTNSYEGWIGHADGY